MERLSQPGEPSGIATVALHVRDLNQLFDAFDPSPFREKDLSPTVEKYIVESVQELVAKHPCTLRLHIDQRIDSSEEQRAVEQAIQVHFARRSQQLRKQLINLLRRGGISLIIGLAFLAVFFLLGRMLVQFFGETTLSTLISESLLIGGWVAMWRPIEIFLYDWWPIEGERRIHERLSRIGVQMVASGGGS